MKVTVTAENYEELVNKLTIDFIVRNGVLQERLEKRQWMTKTEHIKYINEFDWDTMESLLPYMDKNKIVRFVEGSTYWNYFDQYLTNSELLMLLKNRGEKA